MLALIHSCWCFSFGKSIVGRFKVVCMLRQNITGFRVWNVSFLDVLPAHAKDFVHDVFASLFDNCLVSDELCVKCRGRRNYSFCWRCELFHIELILPSELVFLHKGFHQ